MYSGSNGTFDDEYIRYVLDTYSNLIIRTCYSYVKNMHDAEDIAEDVFCEIIRRKPVFNDEIHEKAWLLRTAANKCKNHLKSGWISKTTNLEDNLSDPHMQQDDCAHNAEKHIILDAVNSLPDKYRMIIHLYYYCDLSISEIAALMKTGSATIGTRLSRGREILKKSLGDEFNVGF